MERFVFSGEETVNDQKKEAHQNARASHFSLARALSVLSCQCSNTLACFYRYGLEDTYACRHLIETQKTIDEALKDTLILSPIKPYEATLVGVMNHVNFPQASPNIETECQRHQNRIEDVPK